MSNVYDTEEELVTNHINTNTILNIDIETKLLRQIINKYQIILDNSNDTKSNDKEELYIRKLFSFLIQNRIDWDFDFSNPINLRIKLFHYLQVMQCLRLLSKDNKNLEKFSSLSDGIIKLEIIFMNLSEIVTSNFYPLTKLSKEGISQENKICENLLISILIESITLIKRYTSFLSSNNSDSDSIIDYKKIAEFLEKIVSSKIIDYIISLIGFDNEMIIKIIYMIFIFIFTSVFKQQLISKFTNFVRVSHLISLINNKIAESYVFEYLIILCENDIFREIFLKQDGFITILNKLNSISSSIAKTSDLKYYEDIINKIFLLIQVIYKNEESLSESSNTTLIDYMFSCIQKTFDNFKIQTTILSSFSALCLTNEINVYIKNKYLKQVLKLLFVYTFEYCYGIRINLVHKYELSELNELSCDKAIISNQNSLVLETITCRILRIIYSIEKNRKQFKQLFPTSLLSSFIEIGNFKQNVKYYMNFISLFNSQTRKDLFSIYTKIDSSDIMCFDSNSDSLNNKDYQKIGGYSIIELIGKGGFGNVYKVLLENKSFAMKEIPLSQSSINLFNKNRSIKFLEEQVEEISYWKQFNHPNIVKYFTSFFENQKVYIVMELVDGSNLSELISNYREKRCKFKCNDINKILLDIISGLYYLHSNNVVYGDLNPNNILLEYNLSSKLSDFGLSKCLNGNNFNSLNTSKLLSNQVNNNSVVLNSNANNNHNFNNVSINEGGGGSTINFIGTIFYSAPEVIKGEATTISSDIWSIGCILYELITLKQTFYADNPLTIAKNIMDMKYNKINITSDNKDYIKIIDGCLQLNPKDRISLEEIIKIVSKDLMNNFIKEKVSNLSLKYHLETLKKNQMEIISMNKENDNTLENKSNNDLEKEVIKQKHDDNLNVNLKVVNMMNKLHIIKSFNSLRLKEFYRDKFNTESIEYVENIFNKSYENICLINRFSIKLNIDKEITSEDYQEIIKLIELDSNYINFDQLKDQKDTPKENGIITYKEMHLLIIKTIKEIDIK